jgi:hypothetical protein
VALSGLIRRPNKKAAPPIGAAFFMRSFSLFDAAENLRVDRRQRRDRIGGRACSLPQDRSCVVYGATREGIPVSDHVPSLRQK